MANGTEPSLPLETTEQLGALSGQKVSYARVSSKDQNLECQIEQLKAEKVFTYYTDKASDGSRECPGLDEAMRYVRAVDQLVVTSMDRCARSLTDLSAFADELVSKGVSVKFLKEGQLYSKDSIPIAKLMLGLLGSVAGFERSIIRGAPGRRNCQGKRTRSIQGSCPCAYRWASGLGTRVGGRWCAESRSLAATRGGKDDAVRVHQNVYP